MRELYETFKIGKRKFFIDKGHGHYNCGYENKGERHLIIKKQENPTACYKAILHFLEKEENISYRFFKSVKSVQKIFRVNA